MRTTTWQHAATARITIHVTKEGEAQTDFRGLLVPARSYGSEDPIAILRNATPDLAGAIMRIVSRHGYTYTIAVLMPYNSAMLALAVVEIL